MWVRAVSWYPEGTALRPRYHVGAPLSLGTSRPPPCPLPGQHRAGQLGSCCLGLLLSPQVLPGHLCAKPFGAIDNPAKHRQRQTLAKHRQRWTLVQEDGGAGEIFRNAENPAQKGFVRSREWSALSYVHCWCLKASGLYDGPSEGKRECIPC